ncbi:MAG: N-acetyltransferase family protein [Spirochaetales bacterium]
MHVSFVPMRDDDLEVMLPLYNHYVRESTATFHTQEVDLATLQGLLMPGYPRFGSWRIDADGVPAGYLVLGRYKPREAYDGCAEVTLYLSPAHAGQGLGSQTLEFAEQQARERDFHSLLAIICGENTASIRLFQKHGYTECAHYREVGRKFGRWLDVVSYEKLLEPG